MRPRSAQRCSFHPRVEALEGRELLAVCMVDRLTDVGEGKGMAGDLRYCLTQAQDGDAVVFTVEGTVNLTRALPDLTRDIIIVGPGADRLTVRRDTGGDYGIFVISWGADVVILGVTVSNGFRPQAGGGIGMVKGSSLALLFTTVTGNRASDLVFGAMGGGIFNGGGALAIFHSTISGNIAAFGGGIFNWEGALAIFHSTISGNIAEGGGGIANRDGTLYLSNCTLSGNAGGGLAGQRVFLDSCTITNNQSARGGGILLFGDPAENVLRTSIIANNEAKDAPDISGEFQSLGYNLVGNSMGGRGFDKTDLLDVDPLLGPLADNGGPTFTHALLPGSPAIDAGDPKTYREGFDQRGDGFPRVVGPRVDIGAFEVQQAGFGDTAPPLDPAVAGRLAQPGAGVVWQELTPVVIGPVRHQTADGRPAVRPQTAVTEDSRPLRNGSDGGQEPAEGLGDAWPNALLRHWTNGYADE